MCEAILKIRLGGEGETTFGLGSGAQLGILTLDSEHMRCERSSRGRFLGVRLMDGAASSETYSKNLNTSYLQEVFKVVEIRVVEIDRDQVLRCTLTSHPREVSGVIS